jgi:hypothetical protein
LRAAEAPKKKRSGCLIGAVVLIVLLACLALGAYGVVTLLPDVLPPEFNFGTPTPISPGLPSTGVDAPIVVENFSGVAVCFLFISSSSNDDWGEDWLGSTGMIGDGESLTFWVPADQTVDLRVEDCDGGYDEQFNVYVPVEGITYTLSP